MATNATQLKFANRLFRICRHFLLLIMLDFIFIYLLLNMLRAKAE
jgi:hypothetical protein